MDDDLSCRKSTTEYTESNEDTESGLQGQFAGIHSLSLLTAVYAEDRTKMQMSLFTLFSR